MDTQSFINSSDPDTIDKLYQDFLNDPQSVTEDWRHFFEGFEFAREDYKPKPVTAEEYPLEFKVLSLINAYRQRGHLFTQTNPVRTRRKYTPTLDYQNFGFTEADLKNVYQAGNVIGIGPATLEKIIDNLEKTYCGSIGTEYMYIRHPEVVDWLQKRMESSCNTPDFDKEYKKEFLKLISRAVLFEKFIHKKFPGQKRFSLEGAESLIPALDAITHTGAKLGLKEFIIGMPHRGRLNVLANFMHKPYQNLFHEFEGAEYEEEYLLGDVKYHLGYTTSRKAGDKEVKLTLAPNPSHLEAVDPVVEGIARARIDRDYKGDYKRLAPILIHGDASIAGQGIVYEVLQMSELSGYRTGGTIHVVINNQIGFTTNYLDARSSTYCTDVAKTTLSPVFHVNGDDVEALVHTINLAMEYRQKFHKDVFIDLLCYRKYGHNEGDEPRFTQPILYKLIEKHPNPLEIYSEKLIQEGTIKAEEAKAFDENFNALLEADLEKSKQMGKASIGSFLEQSWHDIHKANPRDFDYSPETGVKKSELLKIGKQICSLPADEKLFRKLVRLQESRLEMLEKTGMLDWAMGELLAYGSLLNEGIPIRLSGQDVARGTFSHRHAVLKVEDSEKEYLPLNHISKEQAKIEIYNSSLSEYGVLGFEYGFALTSPYALTIWEAQFGDFANGGQIIFDQFISSAEDKWNVMNDLVVLLPHGYEGQGPEHSSARMERFLSLCAEDNMQVINPTTPANLFHAFRRQLKREFRKPLIIFTPKSLLRHPACVSPLDDFTKAGFKEIIEDGSDPKKVKRVIFCNGKVYYDLLEEKQKENREDTAIIRIEQLFPLPMTQIRGIIEKYSPVEDWVWVQEEPVNMGAWPFLRLHFTSLELRLVARPPSGSTATGSSKFHQIRQRKIIEKAYGVCDCPMVDNECRMICIGNRWQSFNVEVDELGEAEVNAGHFNAKKRVKKLQKK
ncbi:MAG: 2-oxoglutarate dehydrogenase E1 component [Bacteroidetes bacterium]|nr:MAG: 2-oxoglutarate dehydrogenase E1 component [Bacteroidota bacterium]